jgi:DNA modification methylase
VTARILTGDCRDILPTLDAGSVHCVVTSPPYFGLRSYLDNGHTDKHKELGAESSLDAYIAELVTVFRLVKRILRDDGVLFLNLGDSYCSANILSEWYNLREDLTIEELQLVYRELGDLFGMRPAVRPTGDQASASGRQDQRFSKRSVPTVLQPGGKGEIPSRSRGGPAVTGIIEPFTSEAQKGKERGNDGAQPKIPSRHHRRTRRQVRVLRRDGTHFFVPRSHQGRWSAGIREGNRATLSMAGSEAGRSAEGQISSAVLELQLGDRHARPVPALRLKRSDIPPSILGFFRPERTIKPKDLLGVPWAVALALRDDGWYLRSSIIWAKRAPMPESVSDRPSSAHEHVFLLTKKPRYFYDAIAVQEQGVEPDRQRLDRIGGSTGHTVRHSEGSMIGASATRNMRNVWHLGPEPFPSAHFATFVTEIPRRAILAGSSERGCCAACGAPYCRVVNRPQVPNELRNRGNGAKMDFHSRQTGGGQKIQDFYDANPTQTIGWQPSCHCNAAVVPCTVLDPFSGAGTVSLVAERLGRDSIGIELSEAYARMAQKRILGECPMFTLVDVSHGDG